MPADQGQKGPWTLYVCDECGDYGLMFDTLVTECDPACGEHVGAFRLVEVVPRSEHEKLREKSKMFLDWFDHTFPKHGDALPGVTLYSIAEDVRAALAATPEEEESA